MASFTSIQSKIRQISTTHGRTWTAKQFQKTFSSLYPRLATADHTLNGQGGHLEFVSAQTDLNRYLAEFGIKIRSKNYCSKFYIESSKAGLQELSDNIDEKIKKIVEAKKVLMDGHKRHKGNKLARLTRAQVTRATARIGTQLTFNC